VAYVCRARSTFPSVATVDGVSVDATGKDSIMKSGDRWTKIRLPKGATVTLRQFIRENRTEIDAAIERALGGPSQYKNDEERRLWVLNDEGLYLWARRSGVRI
jgi:hypothetical protein